MSPPPLEWLFATPLWQIDLLSDLGGALPRIAPTITADHADGVIAAKHNSSNFLGA